jgi:hypothetical protein
MKANEITIFIAAPHIAKAIHGRYVCLIRSGEDQRWITDRSLVELSKELVSEEIDWPFVEDALIESGFWTS